MSSHRDGSSLGYLACRRTPFRAGLPAPTPPPPKKTATIMSCVRTPVCVCVFSLLLFGTIVADPCTKRCAADSAQLDVWKEALDRDGFVLIPDFFDRAQGDRIKRHLLGLWELEGIDAGAEFKQEAGARRLANLMNKDDVHGSLQTAIENPLALELCQHVMHGQPLVLSSLNAREAGTATQPA